MARLHKLTARQVQAANKPGRMGDGGGLYLNVTKAGSRSWIFLYRHRSTGRLVELGLGSAQTITLGEARRQASELRDQLASGYDPKTERRRAQADQRVPHFRVFAEEVIAALQPGWRNEKHQAQWHSTIRRYCAPIAEVPVDAINQDDVLAILRPIWNEKNETASRLRGRIEKILDAARAQGLRTGDNPARWKGNLELLLPKRQKLQRGHHPAMPYQLVPAFVSSLRNLESVSARALEFIILTATRSGTALRSVRDGQVTGMRWDEVNVADGIWEIPANRMKTGRSFRLPLSSRPIQILEEMQLLDRPFVFPGQHQSKPLSEMACELMLRRLGAKPATVHGFRTSFRSWAAEETEAADWVAEMCLAHTVGTAVERAYQRSDILERRRALMQTWDEYVGGHTNENAEPPP